MQTRTVITGSKVEFGTSGARGLVLDFSSSVVFSYVYNFIKHIEKTYSFSSVAIGIDNRPSSYKMAQATALAVLRTGYKVEFYGILPTPALALHSLSSKIPSVMVTGSHIPFDRNGLKFYRPDGEITKDDEYCIRNGNYNIDLELSVLPELCESSLASDNYINRYINLFSSSFLSGKHIGVYEHSSSGRDIYAKLLKKLGATVTSLERSDIFVPIDTEAVSQNDRKKAVAWSNKYHFDAIFSTDGDGDRPLVADEKGEWLRGDILGLLAANALGVQAVAIPVSCNSAIEISKLIPEIKRTKIGSPYVIEAFSSLLEVNKRVAGFEANGGFLLASDVLFNNKLLSALPTRDAVLPFLMLMYISRDGSISQSVSALPKRFSISDRVTNFSNDLSSRVLNILKKDSSAFLSEILCENVDVIAIDYTDGIKMELNSGDYVHLRPSGNAPEFRCYVESALMTKAESMLEKVIAFLEGYKITI